jgi:hypothetical protein
MDLRLSTDRDHVLIRYGHIVTVDSVATDRRGVIFAVELTIDVIDCRGNSSERQVGRKE